jgi:hypothetical protein
MVVKFGANIAIEANMINVGDIVELIDENDHEGNYRGRMRVLSIKGRLIMCDHPFYDETVWFDEDHLVVMEECDD